MTVITNNGKRVWGSFGPAVRDKIFSHGKIITKSAGVVCTVLLFALPSYAQTRSPDAFIHAIDVMKRSVAPVMCAKPTGPNQVQPIFDGSAFFVSKRGDFLTDDHVLAQFDSGKPLAGCPSQIWFIKPSSEPSHFDGTRDDFDIDQCVRDATADIARCRTRDDLTKFEGGKFSPLPVVIDSTKQADGTALAVTGFPLGTPFPISARGYVGGYESDARGPNIQLVIDRAAWPGGSGSPVFDVQGRVIGILQISGENTASGISFAASGFALAKFMGDHPFTTK